MRSTIGAWALLFAFCDAIIPFWTVEDAGPYRIIHPRGEVKAYFRKESLSSRYQKKARSRHGVSLLSRPYSTEFGYAQDDGDGGSFHFAKLMGIIRKFTFYL